MAHDELGIDPGTLLDGGRVLDPARGLDRHVAVWVGPEGVTIDPVTVPPGARRIDATGRWVLPGLIDLQVHFRQPGFEHKETLRTGSAAAFAGGVTTVVVMPNTSPPLDTPDRVRFQREEAARVEGIDLWVAAAATKNLEGREPTDARRLADAGAVALTDDGWPVLDDTVMARCLEGARSADLLFMQHAEDTRLSQHRPLTEGAAARHLGLVGQPADAEGVMVERDLALVAQLGARYHVLHTSTARSLRAIARAKHRGLPVTCEASPHHLLLTDEACRAGDPNTKMNPPLRAEADRAALVQGVTDGTVDAVATDHAPHAQREKSRGFAEAPFGVVGLETAFAALLRLYHDGHISAARAVSLMTSGPARVLRRPDLGVFGPRGDLCLVDPDRSWTVTPTDLAGRSHNSAFLGMAFRGRVVATWARGRLRYLERGTNLT